MAIGLATVGFVLYDHMIKAQVINFDVPGDLGAVNYSGQGALVDPGHEYWNPIKQNSATVAGTNSDGVTVSTVILTDKSSSSYNPGQGTQGTPAALESPFLLVNGSVVTDTLNDIPAGTYNLYLYGKNDDAGDADRGTTFTVTVAGTSYGAQSTVNSLTSSFTQGNDYAKFTNVVVGAGGVITFTYMANAAANSHVNPQNEGDFNGLQLIPSIEDTNVPPVISWQVMIPTLNTNEVVVTETTPQMYGAKGDGITDDSAAFQAAINAVYNSGHVGGGVVYVPAGNYAFYTNITIQTGVTVHGDWTDWTKTGGPLTGTTFKVYFGAGQTNAAPFINLQGSTALRDVNIWYPNQNPDNITGYPFTIGVGSDAEVWNVVLVNSYQGITISGSTHFILSTVIGSPLYMGFWVDGPPDVCTTEDIRFSPGIWAESGLSNAPVAGGAYATWMRSYGTGMQLNRIDGLMSEATTISGYNVGIDLEQTTNGSASVNFYEGCVTNCAMALLANEMQSSACPEFTDFTLDSDTGVNRTHSSDATLYFDNCQIIGRNGLAAHLTGSDWQSTMAFQNCAITGTLQLDAGVLSVGNCRLNASTQCVMGASATRAAFVGCTFSPSQKIVNSGNASNLLVDPRSAISNALPIVYWTNLMNNYISRQPARTNLFVATNYGATGNGTTDDTVAIQRALTAAGANGGGIVYLPAGDYRLTNTLDVPDGVELRGAYELRHRTWPGDDNIAKGTILQPYGGQGTTNGPPAVVLEANAGLVGMTISYEDQSSNLFQYPPTIQGRGGNVYVIGVQCPQPYIYVDFDTYACTNHLISMVDGSAIDVGFHVGNGSSGTIMDCQNNWTYWIDNYGSKSDLNGKGAGVESFENDNMQYYEFGNCTELVTKTFSYNENIFMHCNSENDQGASVTAISAMCDSAFNPFVFDGSGPSTVNIVNPDWMVCLGGTSVTSTTNFQGTVRFFNSPVHANPTWDYIINGGDVGFELVHMYQYNNSGIQVNGGVFHLVNCGAFDIVNGSGGQFNVTFGAGGIAGKTNEFIGNYAYNGYTCSYATTNPINAWVDYAIGAYSEMGPVTPLTVPGPATNFTLNYGGSPIQEPVGDDWNTADVWSGGEPASTSAVSNPGSVYTVAPGALLCSPATAPSVAFPGMVLVIDGNGVFINGGNAGFVSQTTMGELRLKEAGNSIIAFPDLQLSGGQIDNGSSYRAILSGEIDILGATNTIYQDSDSSVGSIRAYTLAAWLTGTGTLQYSAYDTKFANDLNITGTSNSFSGRWNVLQGALLGNAAGCLGTNTIMIGPNGALETLYGINNTNAGLILNGQMFLHTNDTFKTLTVNGNVVNAGAYTWSQLNSAYPTNFPATWPVQLGSAASSGSGGLTVLSPVVITNITLVVQPSGSNLILTWANGGTLQTTTNLLGPWTDIGGAASPYAVLPTNKPAQFYRIHP